MRPDALLQKLHSLSVELTPWGEELRYKAPRGALGPELIQELREHKPEIVALLRYGSPAALYPHLGRRVLTPAGEGTLWQVFQDRAGVVIDGRVRFFKPGEIMPKGGE